MRILGFQKTTLLDYPEKLAATIFLSGCNFRCPFCHNASLVLAPESKSSISAESVLEHLKKRIGLLEGVCITGGEPTLNEKELTELILSIKSFGYSIKLDTNGSNPDMLHFLLQEKLIDYVAMDIKNSKVNYEKTAGYPVNLTAIDESIHLLLTSEIAYEFRTTVIKEFHQEEDFIHIGHWIQGAKHYYLQNFVDSDHLICPHKFHSYEKKELNYFLTLLQPHIQHVSIRGFD